MGHDERPLFFCFVLCRQRISVSLLLKFVNPAVLFQQHAHEILRLME
jgi:hypothetical protein